MFLDKILTMRRQQPGPSSLQQEQWNDLAGRTPAPRGFAAALRAGSGPRIIAEFKRASPSQGLLKADLDPARQAQSYQEGGAVALSILTEPHYFQGSQEDLEAARQACSLPALRKDFLLEDWEISQSRCWGADAVLLIAAALPPARLERMLELADQFGLDALVEVHTAEEARQVAPLRPKLIGINNRDLVSFRVDLQVTRQILPLLPDEAVKVAESGFGTHEQLLRFPEVDAFLIGETLVRTEDASQCLRRLRGVLATEKETYTGNEV
jgi:indole-3-glycerol phosphate synthase